MLLMSAFSRRKETKVKSPERCTLTPPGGTKRGLTPPFTFVHLQSACEDSAITKCRPEELDDYLEMTSANHLQPVDSVWPTFALPPS